MNKIYTKHSKYNIDIFKKHFNLISSTSQTLHFFDTFNSNLLKNNLTLYYSQNSLVIQPIDNNQYSIIQPYKYFDVYKPNMLKQATFWHKINNITQNRALLKIASAYFNLHCFKSNDFLINIDVYEFFEQKFIIIDIHSQSKSKKIKEIEQSFFENFFSKSKLSLFENIFLILKINQTDYTTKLNLQDVINEKHFGKISKTILLQLTSFILINKNGIEQDLDTDFLHDFRVSIRRILVFLKNTKQFLGENSLEFINNFEIILKNTNKLRDYDVFIQNIDKTYKCELNEELTTYIQSKREQELSNVLNFLDSNLFVTFFEKWVQWIEKIKDNEFNIELVANEVMLEIFKKLSKLSEFIKPNIINIHAHKLRIYVKHLRYSLDFFGYFINKNHNECNKFTKKLRLYQNKLGFVTDLNFHISFVEQIIKEQQNFDEKEIQNYFIQQKKQIENLKKDIKKIYAQILKKFIKYYFYE